MSYIEKTILKTINCNMTDYYGIDFFIKNKDKYNLGFFIDDNNDNIRVKYKNIYLDFYNKNFFSSERNYLRINSINESVVNTDIDRFKIFLSFNDTIKNLIIGHLNETDLNKKDKTEYSIHSVYTIIDFFKDFENKYMTDIEKLFSYSNHIIRFEINTSNIPKIYCSIFFGADVITINIRKDHLKEDILYFRVMEPFLDKIQSFKNLKGE